MKITELQYHSEIVCFTLFGNVIIIKLDSFSAHTAKYKPCFYTVRSTTVDENFYVARVKRGRHYELCTPFRDSVK